MKKLLTRVLRNTLNKLEDKGYYNPESLTKHDCKRYARLNKVWLKLIGFNY